MACVGPCDAMPLDASLPSFGHVGPHREGLVPPMWGSHAELGHDIPSGISGSHLAVHRRDHPQLIRKAHQRTGKRRRSQLPPSTRVDACCNPRQQACCNPVHVALAIHVSTPLGIGMGWHWMWNPAIRCNPRQQACCNPHTRVDGCCNPRQHVRFTPLMWRKTRWIPSPSSSTTASFTLCER